MIDVTCAIIRNDKEYILIVQRGESSSNPFRWEFPGGKIREGENAEDCIAREICEELSMDIVICGRMASVEYDYGLKQIRLIPFLCDTLDDLPVLSEHIDYKWLPPEKVLSLDLSEADIIVAGNYLEAVKRLTETEDNTSETTDILEEDNDFRDLIRRIRSSGEAEWIAASAAEDPVTLARLVEYSNNDDNKLAFHASWIISKLFDKHPDLLYPHFERIIAGIGITSSESSRRSFLRILSLSDFNKISRKHHGVLADYCLNALNSASSAIAVKAYSMEIIYKLALIYHELSNELAASVNMLNIDSPAGLLARGRIIMKKLEAIGT